MKEKIESVIEKSLKTSTVCIKWIAAVVILGILLSGVTFVQSGEVAIVLRFGKLVGATSVEQIRQPGLHFSLPYIIDKVVRVPVQMIQEVKIDGLYTFGYISNITRTGYVLTGDDNIVLLDGVVKFKITDPIKYVLQVEKPDLNLKELATAALTQEIVSMSVDEVLTKQKMELSIRAAQEVQKRADAIGLGVQVLAIEITNLQPPREVKDAFDMVTSAYVKNETLIQEAKRYREKVIPEAIGERDSLIQKAKSYKAERIAQASSDVALFNGVIMEYKKNPKILRERVYREKVEKIMKKVGDTVLLPAGDRGQNIIFP